MRTKPKRAFTLVELLVVIGIIAVLMAILLPLIVRSMRSAGRTRVAADMQTISTALEAYKGQFGDYPRIPEYPPAPYTPSSGFAGIKVPNTGAAVLGKAINGQFGDRLLPGPPPAVDTNDPPAFQASAPYKRGDVVSNGTPPRFWVSLVDNPAGSVLTDPKAWAYFNALDGADGPGFRVRRDAGTDGQFFTADDTVQGTVYGPYLAAGKLNSQGTYVLDHNGGVILYFPASLLKGLVTKDALGEPQSYVGIPQSPTASNSTSRFNAYDNFEAFRHGGTEADQDVLRRIRIMLGDLNANGFIDNGETAVDQPFILWSPGPDGIYGPAAYTPNTVRNDNVKPVEKCDDVLNVQ